MHQLTYATSTSCNSSGARRERRIAEDDEGVGRAGLLALTQYIRHSGDAVLATKSAVKNSPAIKSAFRVGER